MLSHNWESVGGKEVTLGKIAAVYDNLAEAVVCLQSKAKAVGVNNAHTGRMERGWRERGWV